MTKDAPSGGADLRVETSAQQAEHNYKNARQSLLMIDHAWRKGLQKTFEIGLKHLDGVEAKIRAYQPSAEGAEEHAAMLGLIAEMRRGRRTPPAR